VSLAIGESHATHQRWGRRLVLNVQGISGWGHGYQQAEQASRAPAGGAADCISSAFAHAPTDQRLHRPGPQLLLDEAGHVVGTPILASHMKNGIEVGSGLV
jgi:hypothetical protein